MTDFKVGDRISLQSWLDIGFSFSEIAEVNEKEYRLWDNEKTFAWYYPKSHPWIKETKKEENSTIIKTTTKIQTGRYGAIEVFSHDDGTVDLELLYSTNNANDLREAAKVLSEIADILEGEQT